MTIEKATPPGIALDNEALDKLTTYDPSSVYVGFMESRNQYKDGDYYRVEDVRALFARAAQPQPSAAPDGWKLVPIEPAPEMLQASWDVEIDPTYDNGYHVDGGRIYAAMLAAAPSPNFAARGAEPGAWKVLADDDKPDTTRLLDVILKNGVCLMDRQYDKIEWTQVADWRYSSATGMQVVGQSIDTPEFRKMLRELRNSTVDGGRADEIIVHIDAQLSAARQGQEVERNAALEEAAKMLLNGYFLHDKAPPKLFANEAAKAIREMKRAAPQPTAAPTPHEQEARAAVPSDSDCSKLCEVFEIKVREGMTPMTAIACRLKDLQDALNKTPAAQAGMLPVAQTALERETMRDQSKGGDDAS